MLFYDLMWYNYPEDKEYFKINPELEENIKYKPIKNKELSKDISEYENFIKKYHFLYNKIPFVKNIFVSNSVSFKSVHKNSDLDLLIISKKNRLFLARFFTWIIFKIFWIWWKHEKWKFCIWFWIDEQAQDLYPISIYPIDLYLAYWIAHLQPIYSTQKWDELEIFKENSWVKQIIPNYRYKNKKIINIDCKYWESFIKKVFEKVFNFDFIENILRLVQTKKMKEKKKQLWKWWDSIIISKYMLKFFSPDIRKIVYLKYKSLKPHTNSIKILKNWKIKNKYHKEEEKII